MGEESEQLRREIDQTRRELGTDVDALTEKVSPKRVVERRVDRTREAIGGLKDTVMGGGSDVTSSAHDVAGAVGDTAASTARTARRQAQGNPLAAGVVAFGLGWLVSSLLPPSRRERELARTVKDQAQPAVQAAGEQAGQALSEVKDHLQEPAEQAVRSVRATAADAADTVRTDARSAASDVQGQAQELREQAPTSG